MSVENIRTIIRLTFQNASLKQRIRKLEAELAELKANPPAGYEHYTPETIAAIRSTCSTQASRAGQTQDEVFAESDPPPAKEDSQ